MSLTNYKEAFDNTYQEVFTKVLVASEIASFRFEPILKAGESVERVAYDISGVQVRDVTRGAASVIDAITDTSELLTIDIEKEATFYISDGEATQAGPLNPGEVIGAQVAQKVATDFDARVFGEVSNALYAFDAGDLTTGASTGTPITLTATTVPQMVTRMPAKLRSRNNQVLSNLVFVIDSYGASDVTQFLLGKDIDLAGSVFSNGYTGDVSNARMYVSENLSATAVLGMAANPTDGETITYNGAVVTFVGTLSGGASEIHITSSADITRANLVEWLNAGGANAEAEATNTGYSAASAADQALLTDITAVNDNAADTATIDQLGAGRLVLASTLAGGSDDWGLNFIHSYFGKKGGIEAVLQDMKKVDMRATADRRGTNVFSSYLGGIKTFADGAKKFLNVRIAA
tara:strand:- start:844 stop:2058 length:1215 start_codon:yes stop_codon:yes gene_type:complete